MSWVHKNNSYLIRHKSVQIWKMAFSFTLEYTYNQELCPTSSRQSWVTFSGLRKSCFCFTPSWTKSKWNICKLSQTAFTVALSYKNWYDKCHFLYLGNIGKKWAIYQYLRRLYSLLFSSTVSNWNSFFICLILSSSVSSPGTSSDLKEFELNQIEVHFWQYFQTNHTKKSPAKIRYEPFLSLKIHS